MLKLNAKLSMSVLLMAKVVFPSTPSCAPTAPSSTKDTSFVIGGSTLTVLKPKVSTASTMMLLLNVRLSQLPKLLPLTMSTLMLLPAKNP